MCNFYLGGEPVLNPLIFFKKKHTNFSQLINRNYSDSFHYLTGGAFFSLYYILKYLKCNDDEIVLIPSYLCSTILIPFKHLNVQYKFYKINRNLEIDLDDLISKVTPKVKAVLYINYFGFHYRDNIRRTLKKIQRKGVYLIEDCAQCLKPTMNSISDFSFNSFRKFIPVDGSMLISKKDITIYKNVHIISRYILLRVTARVLRYFHLRIGLGSPKLFLNLIKKSDDQENYYNFQNSSFNWISKYILQRHNLTQISHRRKHNFLVLLDKLKNKSIYKDLTLNTIPLGLPILVKDRDNIRKKLQQKNIYCPIHWILPNEVDKNEFFDSWYLSDNILTIPIPNHTFEDLNRISDTINEEIV